jgi:hypothetical protein
MAAVEQRMAERRSQRRGPWTYAPPIEQIAADLRRLLARHAELLVHTGQVPLRARRLEALELAIASCVDDAARALDLPAPRPLGGSAGGRAHPTRRELRRRLRELVDAGMVLPAHAPLLADDEVA